MGEGKSNQQSCEGVTDMIAEQRVWGDLTGTGHKINKMRLKQGDLQHLYVNKEVPTMHRYGEIPQTLSRNSVCWGASLKCMLMHVVWGINMMSL